MTLDQREIIASLAATVEKDDNWLSFGIALERRMDEAPLIHELHKASALISVPGSFFRTT
jgi:hypothetical protein